MALLIFIFYPVVPTLLYLMTLWQSGGSRRNQTRRSRSGTDQADLRTSRFVRETRKFFHPDKVLDYARMAHCFEGGIESPLQFTLQVFADVQYNVTGSRQNRSKPKTPSFIPGQRCPKNLEISIITIIISPIFKLL